MSLVFGPRKVGIGITSPSQVTVREVINGIVQSDDVDFVTPVSVVNGLISFEVANSGRYRVVASNAYSSEAVTVELLPDLSYGADLSSKVEYLLQGGGVAGVASVNGKTGIVTLTASDVSAKPASYVPAWSEVTGKPSTFTPATHTHSTSQVTGLDTELNSKLENITGLLSSGSNVTITGSGTSASPYVIASTGGGGGAVDSVNGQTGVVVLDAEDVGARADDWEPDLSGLVSNVQGITGIWRGTQEQYDLLTPDEDVLYVIVEA